MIPLLIFLFASAATSNTNYMQQDTIKKPTVAIEEKVVSPMSVLMVRDTAATEQDMSQVINKAYGELFSFINQNGLQPGRVMGFYHTYQPPFVLDAAVEVDKFPFQVTGRIKINKVNGGNAVIAHFKGPYEQVAIAYTAISQYLKEKNKTAAGKPFEVYLNDPGSVKDPSELLTDVYQLIQ
jgi:effector-binding domain-containing protein